MVQVSKFEHETDDFYDLFVLDEVFSQVYYSAKSKFGAEDMDNFSQFRNERLLTIPLDQLKTTLQEEKNPVEKQIKYGNGN